MQPTIEIDIKEILDKIDRKLDKLDQKFDVCAQCASLRKSCSYCDDSANNVKYT